LSLGNFEPLASPQALDAFGIHTPAFAVQESGDAAISITTVLRRQLDDALNETRFVVGNLSFSTLRRTRLLESSTGSPLRDAKLLLYMGDSPASLDRA